MTKKQYTKEVNKEKEPVCDPHENIFGEGDLALWNSYYERNKKLEDAMH